MKFAAYTLIALGVLATLYNLYREIQESRKRTKEINARHKKDLEEIDRLYEEHMKKMEVARAELNRHTKTTH